MSVVATAAEPPAAGPAPPRFREAIQELPWRGGCEPAEDLPACNVPKEWIVEGKLPQGLKGTIYRNGAGRLRVGPDAQYGHWFDGDGYVGALAIDGAGNASVCGRYVRTPRFEAQERYGPSGFAQRGAWTFAAGGLLGNIVRSPTTAANTSVAYTGGRLLALAEGGLPIELHPRTLETVGEYEPQDWPRSGVGPYYSAHGKVVGSTGEVVNFGMAFLPLALHVFTQDPLTGAVLKKASVALDHTTFVHDFAITERHAIFLLPPWVCRGGSLLRAVLGTATIGGGFEWRPELGTRVLVFDLEDMRLRLDTVTAPWSFYHHVNAWEDAAEGKIRLHTLLHNGPRESVELNFADLYAARFSTSTRCSPMEITIDLASGEVSEPSLVPRPSAEGYSCEFPAVHPSVVGGQHRYMYANVAAPEEVTWLNAVQQVDLETGHATTRSFGEHQFAGEPIIIPKPGAEAAKSEKRVFVSVFVYDSTKHRTSLLLLDGEKDLATVCNIELPCHWPYFFHGTWVPAAEDGDHGGDGKEHDG